MAVLLTSACSSSTDDLADRGGDHPTSGGAAGEHGGLGAGLGGSGGSAGTPSHGDGGAEMASSAGASGDMGDAAGAPSLPPAATGFSLSLTNPLGEVTTTRTCNAGTTGAFTYAIGAPEPNHTVEDGHGSVRVMCSVAPNADGTAELISASASGVDSNGAKPVSFSLSSTVPLGGTNLATLDPVPATLTFFSPDTGHLETLEGFPGCTLGPFAVLKNGAMLADIDCPLIGAADDATSGCRVHGTVAVEYCRAGSDSDTPVPTP